MRGLSIVQQADPFYPSHSRFVVCRIHSGGVDYTVLSNHASYLEAKDWIDRSLGDAKSQRFGRQARLVLRPKRSIRSQLVKRITAMRPYRLTAGLGQL